MDEWDILVSLDANVRAILERIGWIETGKARKYNEVQKTINEIREYDIPRILKDLEELERAQAGQQGG